MIEHKLYELISERHRLRGASNYKPCFLFGIYFSASVLASVKQFLPIMQEANRKLDNVPADDVNIECVSDTDDKVIEMVCCLIELLVMTSFNKPLNVSTSGIHDRIHMVHPSRPM